MHVSWLTERSRLDKIPNAPVGRKKRRPHGLHEQLPGITRGGEDGLTFLDIDSKWLLTKHGFAGVECSYRGNTMFDIAVGDIDGSNSIVAKELRQVAVRCFYSKTKCKLLSTIWRCRTNRYNLDVRYFLEGSQHGFGHASSSDNPDFDALYHSPTPYGTWAHSIGSMGSQWVCIFAAP